MYVRFKNRLNDSVNDPMTYNGQVDYTAELPQQREADGPAAG